MKSGRAYNTLLSKWKSFVVDFIKDDSATAGDLQSEKNFRYKLSLLLYALLLEADIESRAKIETSGKQYCIDIHSRALELAGDNLIYELFLPRERDLAALYSRSGHSVSIFDRIRPIIDKNFILGYTLQIARTQFKRASQKNLQNADKKISKAELIDFTRVYTPQWVVSFILENCMPAGLESNSELIINGNIKSQPPAKILDIKILDPACGTGHFLLSALDKLGSALASAGLSEEERIKTLISGSIVGFDLDTLALSVFVLATASRIPSHINLGDTKAMLAFPVLSDENELAGSLSRSWHKNSALPEKFDLIVTNPPYLGRKLISRDLKNYLRQHYPGYQQDLHCAFLARCLELLAPGGRFGTITQRSLFYLPSYENLRKRIVQEFEIEVAIEAGSGVFPLQGGDKVDSALLVLKKPQSDTQHRKANKSLFIDLLESKEPIDDLQSAIRESSRQKTRTVQNNSENGKISKFYFIAQDSFNSNHKLAFNYSMPAAVKELLDKTSAVGEQCEVRQGIATTDNTRFIRPTWMIEASQYGKKWFPYVKGAGTHKWYAPVTHLIDWQDDGAAIKSFVLAKYPYLKDRSDWVVKNVKFMFRRGICFTLISTGDLNLRVLPPGCIYDVGASAILDTQTEEPKIEKEYFLLGILNSRLMTAIARAFNPTVNFQVGDIKRLPLPDLDLESEKEIASLAAACTTCKQLLVSMCDPLSCFDPCLPDVSSIESLLEATRDFSIAQKNSGVMTTIYKTGKSNDPWENYKDAIDYLNNSLSSMESYSSSLVLEAIGKSMGWTKATKDEIESWSGKASRIDNVRRHRYCKAGGELDTCTTDTYLLRTMLGDKGTYSPIWLEEFGAGTVDVPDTSAVQKDLISKLEEISKNLNFDKYKLSSMLEKSDKLPLSIQNYAQERFAQSLRKHLLSTMPALRSSMSDHEIQRS